MKKMFMAVIAMMMTISASAQFYIYYSDGTVAKVDSISMVAPGGTDTPDTPIEPEEPTTPSTGIGVFSVAEGKTVTFSKGNLQYHPANDEWRFALDQTDYIGDANNNISVDYNGWIDMFGWGTGDCPTKTSTSYDNYQTFVDWGTNKIGNDTPNTWRTLSEDEWKYIFYGRTNAQSLFALGCVHGINGVIILPDNWNTPEGIDFVASTAKGLYWDIWYYYNKSANNFQHNYYTFVEWLNMERAGAVFLPACGYRSGKVTYFSRVHGHYWNDGSSSNNGVYFDETSLYPFYGFNRIYARSVRLVRDL